MNPLRPSHTPFLPSANSAAGAFLLLAISHSGKVGYSNPYASCANTYGANFSASKPGLMGEFQRPTADCQPPLQGTRPTNYELLNNTPDVRLAHQNNVQRRQPSGVIFSRAASSNPFPQRSSLHTGDWTNSADSRPRAL